MKRIRIRRNRIDRKGWWVLLALVLITLLSAAIGRSGILLQHGIKDANSGQKAHERQHAAEVLVQAGGLTEQKLDYLPQL